MGSVYIFTCEKDGKVLDNLVKIGFSSEDNPLERLEDVTEKFKGMSMTHKCHAYYVSERPERIEKSLHTYFEKQRTTNIYGRIRKEGKEPPLSTEHFEISIGTALHAFEKIIKEYEKCPIEHVQCPSCDNCRLYRLIRKE